MKAQSLKFGRILNLTFQVKDLKYEFKVTQRTSDQTNAGYSRFENVIDRIWWVEKVIRYYSQLDQCACNLVHWVKVIERPDVYITPSSDKKCSLKTYLTFDKEII